MCWFTRSQFNHSSLLSTTTICCPLAFHSRLHTPVCIVCTPETCTSAEVGCVGGGTAEVLFWSPVTFLMPYFLGSSPYARCHAHDHMVCKFLFLLISLILYLCRVIYRTFHAYLIECQHPIQLTLQWLVKVCHQIG